jgi:threonine synthase
MKMSSGESLATGLRCLSCGEEFPLDPTLSQGCPACRTKEFQAPLDVVYAYPERAAELLPDAALPGLARYAPFLPPLIDELSLGEGGTPLVSAPQLASWAGLKGEVFIKDESRNPTWSHKDRFGYLAVGGAMQAKASAIVVGSTGNHGAASAAYATKAGLPCIIFAPLDCPPAVQSFMLAYGAIVLRAPQEAHHTLIAEAVGRSGWYATSTFTPSPTGPPYGTEGYKTIAYEIWYQLEGQTPGAVFVPTGYAELLFGAWKGFRELRDLGLAKSTPVMIACEPAARAPLTKALAEETPLATVPPEPTIAYAIAVTENSYRGIIALSESGGFPVTVTDDEVRAAQDAQGRMGLWPEASAAAALTGLREALAKGFEANGPVVCISTSSGFKDLAVGETVAPEVEPTWDAVEEALMRDYGMIL